MMNARNPLTLTLLAAVLLSVSMGTAWAQHSHADHASHAAPTANATNATTSDSMSSMQGMDGG